MEAKFEYDENEVRVTLPYAPQAGDDLVYTTLSGRAMEFYFNGDDWVQEG